MASVTYDHVTKTFGDTAAVKDLMLEVQDGEFMVLVGPSGCGKSTALRMLAGLEKVSDGRILIGDRVVNNVAPQSRDIAMVFQSYALYPHMTVYDNLAFGLRNQNVPKKDIDRRVRRAADILDLGSLIKRKPKQLSGGQRQRVALGRAIVREPEAFLMDEPLSNLDAKLRVQTRAEILKLQQELGTTTIYVTHDQVEAMTMGDRIVVMDHGVLQQAGTPEELYTQPRNLFVAGFIGSPAMNLLPAEKLNGSGSGRVAGFRPEHVELGHPGTDAVQLTGRVEVREYLGDEQLVHLSVKDTPILAKIPVEEHVSPGDEVSFSIRRDKIHLFDAESGERAGS
ncbi:MAG TPA: ABC transporter ATP-binding protein [Candidatus Limnocylindria bacterium]